MVNALMTSISREPDCGVRSCGPECPLDAEDRDRGTPRDATPPTPPGIRVPYHGFDLLPEDDSHAAVYETIGSIAAALAKAQAELTNPEKALR